MQLVTLIILICSSFAANYDSAKAQTATPEDQVSFSLLGQDEISLQGPVDSKSFSFRLPADWEMLAGGQLHLEYSAFFLKLKPQKIRVRKIAVVRKRQVAVLVIHFKRLNIVTLVR